MKTCLDTNAYVSFKKINRALTEFLESADEIFVPAVVLGELYAGFYLGSKTKNNLSELADFLELPGVSIVAINHEIAERYGQLIAALSRSGTPIPTNDVWIAATVFETGSRLVTYDGHFNKVPGLAVCSPSEKFL